MEGNRRSYIRDGPAIDEEERRA
uniref:Uncharacterized protein n=1 Tax=Arundo donax TaxID=35708 RepID=A0A0A9GYS6_ARUDO